MKYLLIGAAFYSINTWANEYYAFRCQGNISEGCKSVLSIEKMTGNAQHQLRASFGQYSMLIDKNDRLWIFNYDIPVATSLSANELIYYNLNTNTLYGISNKLMNESIH